MNVAELLLSLKEEGVKLYYRPNTGNAGDSLINCGFFHLADSLDVPYKLAPEGYDYTQIEDDAVLLLPGGGYLVSFWSSGDSLINTLLQFSFKVILLPQSVQERKDLVLKLREKDVIFLREGYSYEYVKSLNPTCQVEIDHDLAFHVDVQKLKSQNIARPKFSAKNLIRIFLLAYHIVRSKFYSKLFAYRTDGEATGKHSSSLKNDISLVCKFGNSTFSANFASARALIHIVSSYEEVHSDRLHVVIAALLAGTKVFAHANAYYKIKGVLEYSVHNNPSLEKYLAEFAQ